MCTKKNNKQRYKSKETFIEILNIATSNNYCFLHSAVYVITSKCLYSVLNKGFCFSFSFFYPTDAYQKAHWKQQIDYCEIMDRILSIMCRLHLYAVQLSWQRAYVGIYWALVQIPEQPKKFVHKDTVPIIFFIIFFFF